ncbi:MAG: acyltransferase domain-containing protein [Clostridia bacterium]|nr:acyltransferase domain-containing protein [Clostridia bacterium]
MIYKILNYVSLDRGLIKALENLDKKQQSEALRLSKKLSKGNANCLSKKEPMIKLAASLKSAEKTLSIYKKYGISEDIFRSTFDDIRIWCENFDNKGLDNIGWIKNHINFKLFKIGRLQFQFFKCRSRFLDFSKQPFSRGEKVINIHIPQGEKLNIDECKKSLCKANEFFKEYFPQFKYGYYFCESWLLCENNRKFMDENSNIVKFMNLFDIRCNIPYEKQTFERIFGIDMNSKSPIFGNDEEKRKAEISCLSENTSLQRSAKNYLLDGGRFGMGIGIINKDKCVGNE